MQVHPCDALGQGKSQPFDFQAALMSPDTVIVTAPALDFADRGEDDEEVRDHLEIAEGEFDEAEHAVTMEAFDNHRNTLDSRVEKTLGGCDDKALSFSVKKCHTLVFVNGKGPLHLSSEVSECHKRSKNLLKTEPLPIERKIEKMVPNVNELDWDDVKTHNCTVKENGVDVPKQLAVLPVSMFVLQRFIVRLADLNQELSKKGRIVKPADAEQTAAMMSALDRKEKNVVRMLTCPTEVLHV